MTREQHLAEAERYERLEAEARRQVTAANTPEYYRKRAAEHRQAAENL